MKKTLLFFFFISTILTPVFGQGIIRVSVFDNENGEPLIGANVIISGTTTGDVTDLDGKTSLEGLEEGTYSLQVSYVSYQPQTIEEVVVENDKIATLTVRLQPESIGLDEVVVQANAIRSTESALLTVQKKSSKVLDAISSEQFSRNGDNDAASAVKRVTGITIEGGKYIYVRGLGDRYSKTILNGATIPGLDPNKNSVQLDLFPSNLIDNIIVYKTFSPDLPGDFSGGLVDIATKDFPDRFTLQVSGSLGYNPQVNLNNDFLTYEGGNTEWLGFDDGFRDLPKALRGLSQDDFPQPIRSEYDEIDRITKSFENRQFSPDTKSPFLDHRTSISLGNQKKVFGKDFGFVGSVSYNKSHDFYGNGFTGRYRGASSGLTSLESNRAYLLDDYKSDETVVWGAILNSALKLNNFNKVKLNLMYNKAGVKTTRLQSGLWDNRSNQIEPAERYETYSLLYQERSLATGQVIGEHNLKNLGNIEIKWLSSYTLSDQNEPDLRFFPSDYTVNENDTSFRVSNLDRPSRYYRNMTEFNWDNKLDITIPVSLWNDLAGKIKFGGAYTVKEREFREDRYEYSTNGRRFNGSTEDFFSDANLGVLEDGSLGMFLSNFTELRNNYDAEQKIYAGYLMVESSLTKKLKMTGGVRYEETAQNLLAFNGSEGEISTKDFLPAVNLTYEVIDNMNIRLAYSKTLARPSFREFAPLQTFNFLGDFVQVGNPNLKRTLIHNYDFRWEMYPTANEYVGVSLFYKDFRNPIENTLSTASTNTAYIYNNVGQAKVQGVEIELKKNLDFIAYFLKNFKVGTNLSLIKSEVELTEEELFATKNFNPDAESTRDLYNQSPFILNANITYDNIELGTQVNATYNVFGERLVLVSTDLPYVYEQPRPELNLNIKQSLSDRWVLKLSANNLLNPLYEQKMDFKGIDYTFQDYRVGRSFSLGFNFLIE